MDIQKLLFATRFDDLWFDALQSLLGLKKVALNHVVLLTVIERQKVAMRRGLGYRKTEEIKFREIANIRFIDWAETLFELGLEVGAYIVVGSLVKHVISAAEKERVDLIVIGKERKSKIGRWFSGSDLTEIIRRANTPILVYEYLSQNMRKAEKPLKRPLLAMDFSAASMRAVEFLLPINEIVESVNIINVVSEKSLNCTSAMAVQKCRRESRGQLDKIYAKFMDAGIKARSHVYVGDPLDQIEKAARDCQATMIIAGTRGKGRRKDRSLGRVPKGLFETSVYPVLVIPPE